MKKLLSIIALSALLVPACNAKDAKYVFYFIGDGMGVNQVMGTQMYLAELEGRIGIVPLCFTQFPVTGYELTYSASSDVTDSAAGGTALSTGSKTNNNVLGMLPDKETPAISIAAKAKKAGKKVGICTTVSIDHATPGAFYAHVPSRNDYHTIGLQLAETGYDFFAGSDFQQVFDKKEPGKDEGNYVYAEKNGYTIARGYDEYKSKASEAKKMLLLQPDPEADHSAVPFAIDRTENDLTITQITEAAIDFLMKDNKDGFFCMVEGGRIDQSLHGNDAATCFNEVIDMDNAIKLAFEFYKKHPKETLIVVTADHETGGIDLGLSAYMLSLKNLQYQNISEGAFTDHLKELNAKSENGVLTWDEIQEELKQHFGFWDKVRLSDAQTNRLRQAYVETFGMSYGAAEEKQEEYYKVDKLSDLAVQIMSEKAQIAWGTGAHSAGYGPIFAIGAGQELFTGQIENIDIPRKIAQAAGIAW